MGVPVRQRGTQAGQGRQSGVRVLPGVLVWLWQRSRVAHLGRKPIGSRRTLNVRVGPQESWRCSFGGGLCNCNLNSSLS